MFLRSVMYMTMLTCLTLTGGAGGSLVAHAADRPVYIQSETLVVVQVKDTNRFLAYSKAVGKWNAFTFPEAVRAVPVMSGGVCAFLLEGEAVTELVAVDLKGNWRKSKLPAAARKCVPIVTDDVAVFLVDGKAHAFSGELGTWDAVPASVTPELTKDTALIAASDSIAVFSSATGKWAVAKTTK